MSDDDDADDVPDADDPGPPRARAPAPRSSAEPHQKQPRCHPPRPVPVERKDRAWRRSARRTERVLRRCAHSRFFALDVGVPARLLAESRSSAAPNGTLKRAVVRFDESSSVEQFSDIFLDCAAGFRNYYMYDAPQHVFSVTLRWSPFVAHVVQAARTAFLTWLLAHARGPERRAAVAAQRLMLQKRRMAREMPTDVDLSPLLLRAVLAVTARLRDAYDGPRATRQPLATPHTLGVGCPLGRALLGSGAAGAILYNLITTLRAPFMERTRLTTVARQRQLVIGRTA